MTDVMVYNPGYRLQPPKKEERRRHSNHRVFGNLVPGDRPWVVTSGKSLGLHNNLQFSANLDPLGCATGLGVDSGVSVRVGFLKPILSVSCWWDGSSPAGTRLVRV
jgi:hypothetical protein